MRYIMNIEVTWRENEEDWYQVSVEVMHWFIAYYDSSLMLLEQKVHTNLFGLHWYDLLLVRIVGVRYMYTTIFSIDRDEPPGANK